MCVVVMKTKVLQRQAAFGSVLRRAKRVVGASGLYRVTALTRSSPKHAGTSRSPQTQLVKGLAGRASKTKEAQTASRCDVVVIKITGCEGLGRLSVGVAGVDLSCLSSPWNVSQRQTAKNGQAQKSCASATVRRRSLGA